MWLAGQLPFARVSEVLSRVGQVSVATTTVWQQTGRHGQRLQAQAEAESEQVSLERTRWQHERYAPRARKSVSLDGGRVHIRGEGWKELKAGVIGDIEQVWTEEGPCLRLTNLRYCGVIGAVARFKTVLWALAVGSEVPTAGTCAVTADGASWIWRLVADLFPCSEQIVDWYHATQHVYEAARARYPDNDLAARDWVEELKPLLYQGAIEQLTTMFEAEGIAHHSGYFTAHKRRMQYRAFAEDGLPIGSGAVESGIKQFKQRLAGAGMRWSRQGAEQMTIIAAAVLSDDFDRLWDAA